jgi:phage recombination protein Bet
MNAVVPLRTPDFSNAQLALIRKTVAADTNQDEFELFVHTARHLRLDPLRRQIYAFVYNKDKPAKRKMSIITGIDGFRTIAERTGNYRPDEDEPTIEVDAAAKSPANPSGIVKATVRVFKHSHGAWHKVTASAYWEEYAPLKEGWTDTVQVQNGTWPEDGQQAGAGCRADAHPRHVRPVGEDAPRHAGEGRGSAGASQGVAGRFQQRLRRRGGGPQPRGRDDCVGGG